MLQPARIENPTNTLAAPPDWVEEKNGHCSTLPVRVEQIGGVTYMRSAWDIDGDHLLHLFSGAKLILGIAGTCHPVVHMAVDQLPEDFQTHYTVKPLIGLNGERQVYVEGLYAAKGKPQKVYCREPVDECGLSIAVGRAMDKVDELARQNGWAV